MKLSPKQVAASVTGAVAAALMASFFGEKGTIIGVALGTAVATTSTAVVMQSIDRTHEAVREVVGSGQRPALLRRLRGTGTAGRASGEVADSPVVDVAAAEPAGGTTPGPAEGAGTAAVIDERSRVGAAGPASELRAPTSVDGDGRRLVASSRRPATAASSDPASARPGATAPRPTIAGSGLSPEAWWRIRWPVLALSAGIVFTLALLVVTGIELLAGRPLSSLVGSNPATGGTSAGNLLAPPGTTAPTTTSTTSPTTTVPRTSTTTTGGSASTTVLPGASTTTSSTTTTTSSTTTTTLAPTVGTAAPPG